jgi:hypothetical protein
MTLLYRRSTVINSYLSVIMLEQVHDFSANPAATSQCSYLSVIILRQVHNFSTNPAATSQCNYNILAILYLLCISEKILYLFDDITIILHVADTRL